MRTMISEIARLSTLLLFVLSIPFPYGSISTSSPQTVTPVKFTRISQAFEPAGPNTDLEGNFQGVEDFYLEVNNLRASDAQATDLFGDSIAISGDTLVVGAQWEDGGPGNPATQAGAAYVYERNLGGSLKWGEAAILHASDLQAMDLFGYDVAISGDTIVVGAVSEDGGPGNPVINAGAAYIFERDLGGADNWGQAAILHANDAQGDDYFGWSVSISGDTVVVAALLEDGGPGDPVSSAGAVYIFERDLGGPDAWGEATILRASDSQESDQLGMDIAISGDYLVAGAHLEDGGPGNPLPAAGAAYVFERNLGGKDNWGEAALLRASDAQINDGFGGVVAISGNTAVVATPNEDGGPGDPALDAGAVYVFERNLGGSGNWGESAILHASDAQAQDGLGWSAGISGDTIIAGAYAEDGGPGNPITEAGAAYLFKRDLGGADNWGQAAILRARNPQSDDFFGESTAVTGTTFVIASPFEDGGPGNPVSSSGTVYIFMPFSDRTYLPIASKH